MVENAIATLIEVLESKEIPTKEDICHYCRVVTALARTIQTQAEVDRLYPQVEKDAVAVELSPKT